VCREDPAVRLRSLLRSHRKPLVIGGQPAPRAGAIAALDHVFPVDLLSRSVAKPTAVVRPFISRGENDGRSAELASPQVGQTMRDY
jgi:hypothetical protein